MPAHNRNPVTHGNTNIVRHFCSRLLEAARSHSKLFFCLNIYRTAMVKRAKRVLSASKLGRISTVAST